MMRIRSLVYILAGVVIIALSLGGGVWVTTNGLLLAQTVPTPTPEPPPPPLPTATPDEPEPVPTDTPVPPPTDTPDPSEPAPPPTDTPAPGEPAPPPGDLDPPAAPPPPDEPEVEPEPEVTATPTSTPTAAEPPTATPEDPAETPTPLPEVTLALYQEVNSTLAQAGDVLTYTLTVENLGPGRAQGVRVRDHFIDELEVLTATASLGQVTVSGQVVTARISELQAIASDKITITVRVAMDTPHGMVLDNIAEARAQNAGPVSAGISVGMPPAYLPPTGKDKGGG